MGIGNVVKNICMSLGTNNKPTYVVMAIAIAKGIFRPMFTMMDKKEDPETKKYTAIREGLTELIAIPVYWACGELSGKLANVFAKPKNFMDKQLFKQYNRGDKSKEVLDAFNKAKELAGDNLPKMNKNLMFIGVCTAALFVIPALCSVAIKPIMNSIQKKNTKQKNQEIISKVPVYSTTYPAYQYDFKRWNSFSNVSHMGMKVGGV